MSQNDFIVRPGKREDMTQVFNLIKELAIFEKMPEQVKTDAKVLENDGFDLNNPLFFTFVAETKEEQIVGYALYYLCYSTWEGKSTFLEDLYVQPQHRKRGIGKELFFAVAKVAKTNGSRLDFHVLSWNPAIKFYESLGAINLTAKEDWHMFRMTNDALGKLKFL